MTNKDLLLDKVEKSGLRIDYICEQLGISKAVWYQRCIGRTQFKRSETYTLKKLLKLTLKEWHDIFFADDVGTKSPKESKEI